jgi:hypothetical protein
MMRSLTCVAARRRLQAFHDGELPVTDQIAVQGHLDWCDTCSEWLADMRFIGTAIRGAAPGRDLRMHEDAGAFAAAVISRCKAEQDASFVARVQHMFDDLHLVYAGVGAAVATAACVVIMSGMVWFAPTEHPDSSPSASLSAIMNLLATPGSANAIAFDAASHARGSARFQAANETAEEDAVFELASIVTRDERVINLERLRTGRKATRDEAKAIDELLESVARARIDPGAGEAPAPDNGMVWLVTSMTVRATKVIEADLPLPPMKIKRAARVNDAPAAVTL